PPLTPPPNSVAAQDACFFISELVAQKVPIQIICQKFLDYCLLANSRDNMTVILCLFPASSSIPRDRYLNAKGYTTATAIKPNLGQLNSHTHKSKTPNSGFQVRRASITLFNELKQADGHIKIATVAATHADEVLGLTKEIVSSWNEQEVVDRFLGKLELDAYAEHFLKEGVDGKLLLELTQLECEDDLMMSPLDARFLKMATTYLTTQK
ncbi:hypothetical protein TeGR_g6867, partial [Tetraparma gracilis]